MPLPRPLIELTGDLAAAFWHAAGEPDDDHFGHECYEWPGTKDREGYGRFKHRGRTYQAHRVALHVLGRVDPGTDLVCHRCDNPPCINPKHLFVGTNSDNRRDSVAKGRTRSGSLAGSRNPRAKLTEDAVAHIRRLIAQGHANRQIADRFGVSLHTISKIRTGRSWKAD